jgi:predicted permease
MTSLRMWATRVREWLTSRRVDADFDEELQTHLDLLTRDFVRNGATPAEAARLARQKLGGLTQTRELVRHQRGLFMLETVTHDVRHAIRALLKAPGFTLVAVLTLALGFGVNTAIFSLVDAVMLRPLPYRDADRLVSLWEFKRAKGPVSESSSGSSLTAAPDPGRMVVAPANFVDYQKIPAFATSAGVAGIAMNLTGGTPERLFGESVTSQYFEVLGAAPALGRTFSADDDQVGHQTVLVLSDGLWRRRFGADSGIIGQPVTLDGIAFTVVGVMRPDFEPVTGFSGSDAPTFWMPAAYPADLLANRGDHEIDVIARLAPGVTVDTARAQLQALSASLARAHPDTNDGIVADTRPLVSDLVSNVRTSLVVLLGAVGLIVLIACVNVANLLIVRAASKRHDIAVRFALGASRGRVMGELVTQSLVLAAAGGAAGLALGSWTRGLLVHAAPATIPRLATVAIDGRVLAFTALVALLTTVFFGVVPAWQVGRARPIEVIRSQSRSVVDTGVLRWRGALLAAEIAFSTILLVGAGLMLRSFATLNALPLGFSPNQVLAINVTLPPARYKTAGDRLQFFDALAARVAAEPGVRSVAFANRFPMRGGWSSGFAIDRQPGAGGVLEADFQAVSAGYFPTLGIPLLRGRLLTPDDRGSAAPVAIVSEEFGRRFLHGADPIGHTLARGPNAPSITIVGVVSDVRRAGHATSVGSAQTQVSTIQPQVYLPAAQTSLYPVRLADFAIRTDGDPLALAHVLQDDVWAMDKDLPITNQRTLDEILWQGVADARFETTLFTLFGGLALALAMIGVYGVVAYAVTKRIPEIGVRMSLGASRAAILRWILAQALGLVAIGAVVGLGGALLVSRFLTSLLFSVGPMDLLTYVAAVGILGVAALAASLIAGQAATRVDPVSALRSGG